VVINRVKLMSYDLPSLVTRH